VKIAAEKVRALCRKNGRTLDEILRQAGVSRNAYYTLARKASILPKSIRALANELDVHPSELLVDDSTTRREIQALIDRTDAVATRHPEVNKDNVRHALLLLKEAPIARLRRALTRGQRFDFRKG
jgi:transcriptional regulator with XRE-family HTH domain